jgi:hypothetical protein
LWQYSALILAWREYNVLGNIRDWHILSALWQYSAMSSHLWSSGQSSWLQIQRSGLDSLRYQIFWEVVGLERGPLSLVSTIMELLGRKSSGFGLESRGYGQSDPSRWPGYTLYPQKLTPTSPTICSSSAGTVRSRTQATEFINLASEKQTFNNIYIVWLISEVRERSSQFTHTRI